MFVKENPDRKKKRLENANISLVIGKDAIISNKYYKPSSLNSPELFKNIYKFYILSSKWLHAEWIFTLLNWLIDINIYRLYTFSLTTPSVILIRVQYAPLQNMLHLTLSWRRSLSYRNLSIDLPRKRTSTPWKG